MRLSAHLTFGGSCADAFPFYQRALGGTRDAMVTYNETAMASSVPGFFVLISVAEVAEATRLFAALADVGQVRMPLSPTFWSPAFGIVVDRFGTPWEVTTDSAQ